MKKEKNFLESRWYEAISVAYWFVAANLCFLLAIAPVIMLIALIGEEIFQRGIIYFTASLIFAGPAIAALFSTVGKYQREKSMTILRDYIKYYRLSFLQSMIYFMVQSASGIMMIKYIEILSYKEGTLLFRIIILLVIVISIALGTFIYPIISRFNLGTLDILRLALYYSILRYKETIMNLVYVTLAGALFVKGHLLLALFTPVVVAYLIMLNLKQTLIDIEENLRQE